jgi:hypothetical protein
MFIINVQDVRIAQNPDLQNPDRQIFTLDYLSRQYVRSQAFELSQLDLAQDLWRQLTADRSQPCLIVKEANQYSVWVENSRTIEPQAQQNINLESVFRAQMFSIDTLLAEVQSLLGQKQAESFGKEILGSIPTIPSLKDLPSTIEIAMKFGAIDKYALSAEQLSILGQEIERLGGKYLGKNRTKELLNTSQQGLPSRLKPNFQAWLLQQSL